MPSGRGHVFYSPVSPDDNVVYAKVNKGGKKRKRSFNGCHD